MCSLREPHPNYSLVSSFVLILLPRRSCNSSIRVLAKGRGVQPPPPPLGYGVTVFPAPPPTIDLAQRTLSMLCQHTGTEDDHADLLLLHVQ